MCLKLANIAYGRIGLDEENTLTMPDTDPQHVAAIQSAVAYDVNGLLGEIVVELRARGVVLAGAVQSTETLSDECCSPLSLIDVGSNRIVGISQELGPHSSGCRLDQRGLAEAGAFISQSIENGADLVVINKFGKAESEGDGLLSCFAEAVSAGVPVLTSVRPSFLEAWQAFHGGMAVALPPSRDAILQWYEAVKSRGTETALS